MIRMVKVLVLTALTILLAAAPALACGGLIGPNGTVNLVRTTTLAAYHDGEEHYITSFAFAGGGAKFGSIVPLPAVPSDIKKAGRWTLQRLLQEVQPPAAFLAAAESVADGADRSSAEVLIEKKVDALDITVLKGGGDEVGVWASENGFALPPDAPEVLDFYASRSPIFMAVRFDTRRAAARGIDFGDGIPIHLTIPTDDPWVPLRILGLGKDPRERVEADVFLLTDHRPSLLPGSGTTYRLDHSAPATELLLSDLAADRGMEWLPRQDMWLSYLKVDSEAGDLKHDLAIDATGIGSPSPIAAGIDLPLVSSPETGAAGFPWWGPAAAAIAALLVLLGVDRSLVRGRR